MFLNLKSTDDHSFPIVVPNPKVSANTVSRKACTSSIKLKRFKSLMNNGNLSFILETLIKVNLLGRDIFNFKTAVSKAQLSLSGVKEGKVSHTSTLTSSSDP